MASKEKPGIHDNVILGHFSREEFEIIKNALANEFFVTNGGATISVGKNAAYKYLLVKPQPIHETMFNLTNEILVLFSSYKEFDSRELIAIEKATLNLGKTRLERICSIVISEDDKVERKALDLRNKDQEARVIIPFTYKELAGCKDEHLIRNRIRSQFYSQDLFDFHSPLKKDIYFFGRHDLINSIANRHRANENSALFGLRRTGKTSVIYGITRSLEAMNACYVIIDCQNTSFHQRRWNQALYYIIDQIKEQNRVNLQTHNEADYSTINAADCFRRDLFQLWKYLGEKSILIILDEIENITFNISPSKHWSIEEDFIYFWQSLRSIRQRHEQLFSYLIVGTNPTCIEQPSIHGKDNPIFSQFPFEYIQPFTVEQIKEMVSGLGRMMGLNFDEHLYGKLYEDFGGHPFLIRIVCSIIHRKSSATRPTRVDRNIYDDAKNELNAQYSHYFDMVVNVLEQFYPDEYSMLEYLSLNEIETFRELARYSPQYTSHLLGYGIVEKGSRDGDYNFRIDAIRKYIASKNKYKKTKMSNKEKLAEISERRNQLEHKLRKLILKSMAKDLGTGEARSALLSFLDDDRKKKAAGLSYKELFDSNVAHWYFEDLRKIINKHWPMFVNIFNGNQKKFNDDMENINRMRYDAHAKFSIPEHEFLLFRSSITNIENLIEIYV